MAGLTGPMWRTTFNLTGDQVGKGWTSFYADGAGQAQSFATSAYTFMVAVATFGQPTIGLPDGLRYSQLPTVDKIDSATGKITDQVSVTPGADIVGTSSAGYSATTGACVTWHTLDFLNGRRVRGRSFFVPLAGGCYDGNGTLHETYRTSLNAAANTFLTTTQGVVVWHRPTFKGASDGGMYFTQTGSTADTVAVLRSRR